MSKTPVEWMNQALREAHRGTGATGPNPLVGAVIVRKGRLVGSGYHAKVGDSHAEVMALSKARGLARGADLFVTLEPCSHFGRTPPCVNAVVAAGIRRVWVGTLDPNPNECGSGVKALREAGVEVEVGVGEQECRRINEAYFKFITSGIPFVTAKVASSIDGRIACFNGQSKYLTGSQFLKYAHGLRRDSNAVLVGGNTVDIDDPELTVRLVKPLALPLRVVVLGRTVPPIDRRVFDTSVAATLVVSVPMARASVDMVRLRRAVEPAGVEWVEVDAGENGRPDAGLVLVQLGRRGVSRLLVEAGARLTGAMLDAGLVDRLVVAWSPRILGHEGVPMFNVASPDHPEKSQRAGLESVRRMGVDVVSVYRLGPDYTGVIPWQGGRPL